jgi:glucose-6-phosphate 1-dehydrogenase
MAPTDSPAPTANENTSIVVLGASGDLAFKKTYPALFGLYTFGFLPASCQIIGYARSAIELEEFKKRVSSKIATKTPEDKIKLAEFLKMCYYVSGKYDQAASFQNLNTFVLELEAKFSKPTSIKNRIFYMALYVILINLFRPPSVFMPASAGLRDHVYSKSGKNRVVVEKPFGKDFDSSKELSKALGARWEEDEVCLLS